MKKSIEQFLSEWKKNELPQKDEFITLLNSVCNILENESITYRKKNINGKAGSLLEFPDQAFTIIVPDLHARSDFLEKLLKQTFNEKTVYEHLQEKTVRIICLGDGLHSEIRARDRWIDAFEQYKNGIIDSKAMNEEMAEGLSTMTLVMMLKNNFSENFHYLKGNHENILNESYGGNHSFRKFVFEGDMTFDFMIEKYGLEVTELYSNFEKLLPLFVNDLRFLTSHAEPLFFLNKKELINASLNAEFVNALTWTQNGFAKTTVVKKMLKKYCKNFNLSWYFAGHRPVAEIYNVNEENHFVQFHNPYLMTIVIIEENQYFDFETGFIRL
ncbi:MAG: hypothetical protein GX220_07745 [Treponema sp.]|nr:hypothetical protein [Treponema sp.]